MEEATTTLKALLTLLVIGKLLSTWLDIVVI